MDMQCTDHHHFHKCFSWSAVFAGAIVGVGLSFLLNLFSVAIGLTAFTTSSDGATALAIGGFIGLLIGGIVSMFIQGWVAGFLGAAKTHSTHGCVGVTYGFAAWGLALLIGIFITSHASMFISSYSDFISDPVKTTVRSSHSTMMPATNTEVTVSSDKAAEDLAKSAFAVFAIFFIGALSSAFGGYCGQARCAQKCEQNEMRR